MSLLGVDPLAEAKAHPFQRLRADIQDSKNTYLEGISENGLHRFFEVFTESDFFWEEQAQISKEQLQNYEENIVAHTRAINKNRNRPVVWKYFQWLSLLFVEIYLDRYFSDKEKLRDDLNAYLRDFNAHNAAYTELADYELEDLNKICVQNATGSGKTLLMHVNILQFRHYARRSAAGKEISRVILLSPNERLSKQHEEELKQSGFAFIQRLSPKPQGSLDSLEITEITKLADSEGPNTIATRSLGDQNLLLVDEGHRGMSGKEEGVWFQRRTQLSERGFVFEYSATFAQAVAASQNAVMEDSYAKSIIFDYSYRWFYEDGYGKDYQIFNIPPSHERVQDAYLCGGLLRFYQQLCIYRDKYQELVPFNLEKPLWVFVGSTVSKTRSLIEREMLSDVGLILEFFARFLAQKEYFTAFIELIIAGDGNQTGLLDTKNNFIFHNSFRYLNSQYKSAADTYRDILNVLFQNADGGLLRIERILGDSGEIELFAGASSTPFGLINVGDAKGLCDYVEDYAQKKSIELRVMESDFAQSRFATVKDSSSPINLLVGSKKFIEGWDCWRVSCMGLMHVGKSEGTQIVQLFGRGVRLKGYGFCLKRSKYISVRPLPHIPQEISELETLNVFGIDARFMESFKDQLAKEGLPTNESKLEYQIPLNVLQIWDKKLKVLRVKNNREGKAYYFNKDGYLPPLSTVPNYIRSNKVISDWYSRVQVKSSVATASQKVEKVAQKLNPALLDFLDFDTVYFEMEKYKREQNLDLLKLNKAELIKLLKDNSWYELYYPGDLRQPRAMSDLQVLQRIVINLLSGYLRKFYEYHKNSFYKNRYEYAELSPDDKNLPKEKHYTITIDADDPVAQQIERLCADIKASRDKMLQVRDLIKIRYFDKHLYQPLIQVSKYGKISIMPVALNQSEFDFVEKLIQWCKDNEQRLNDENLELYLLRNLSRGKGMGFFEAGNFHPDFILWLLKKDMQYIHFIEPHGLMHEGILHPRIQFHKTIKDIEKRLADKNIQLNSWVLSATPRSELKTKGYDTSAFEQNNVLFLDEDGFLDKVIKV